MRVVAWGVLRARTWVALGVAYLATVLASGDGRAGWTIVVAVGTFSLAGLSVWMHYLDEHPEEAERLAERRAAPRPSKHDEWVADSVRRYEESRGGGALGAPQAGAPAAPKARDPEVPGPRDAPADPPRRLSKQEARVAEILRRYEEQAEARRAALKQGSGPQ